MADADEDAILNAASAQDVDLSDETQDFRFLASISREDAKIPKRGEKDFESHATVLQSNALADSREAMHQALAYQRVHQPKGYTMAIYHPSTNMVYTTNPKGPLFSRMGHVPSPKDDPLSNNAMRGQRLWLLPEEALYLLERGTIDIRWPSGTGLNDAEGLPMSLQAAYATFIGDEPTHDGYLSLERYSVYASLKRSGYIVHRAPSWNSSQSPLNPDCFAPTQTLSWYTGLYGLSSWIARVSLAIAPSEDCRDRDHLVSKCFYRNYKDVYTQLAIVGRHNPTVATPSQKFKLPTTISPWHITYNVWKPNSAQYKKSAPGCSDFRIAVISARETQLMSLDQLAPLMDTVPYSPPDPTAQLYQKLKHGYKSVILAVVDQGVTSYLRIADAAFGQEKIYQQMNRSGNKRGGRAGGRGRARGR